LVDDGDRRIIPAVSGTTTPTVDKVWSVADAAAAGGTYSLVAVAHPDGHLRLGSTGTTNHFGVEAQSLACIVTPNHATLARGRMVFEARVDLEAADTVFVGCSEAGDNFMSATSGLPNNADFIGFYTADNGATLVFHSHTDNSGGTAVSGSYTIPASLVDADFNRLGFAVNADGSIEICVNGQLIDKKLHGISNNAAPIETLAARLSATAGGGTTAATILIDRVDVFVSA
jgi:hypothetical protein